MSTKLQYPINQLRDSPLRAPKTIKPSKSLSQAASQYPEINSQRPTFPEENQASGNSFPRRDREYRLQSDASDHHRNRSSTDSLQSKTNDEELSDGHILPEINRKVGVLTPSVNQTELSLVSSHSPSSHSPVPVKQPLLSVSRSPGSRVANFSNGHELDGRVEIGLENLGNTCFMNSALQCLLHIQPLVEYFLQGCMERDVNPKSPKKGMLAASFNHLIQEVIAKQSGSTVAPINFQRAVAAFAPYLLDFQQQDSQEFLRFLLDGMSEDLCRRHQIPHNEPASFQQRQVIVSASRHHSESGLEKPTSSGSASTTGRLSGRSGPHQQSILPMLPGATIESVHSPTSKMENGSSSKHASAVVDVMDASSSSSSSQLSSSVLSPRYNSVHKLRMETRAMQDGTDQPQQPLGQVDKYLSSEMSAKMRITREISTARKIVNDDSMVGTSTTTVDSDKAMGHSNNNNNGNNSALTPINFAETAPAALSSMLQNSNNNNNNNNNAADANSPVHDARVESAPSSARVAYAPSFSRQLRDVMTGKTLRNLRRDRTNSASGQNQTSNSNHSSGLNNNSNNNNNNNEDDVVVSGRSNSDMRDVSGGSGSGGHNKMPAKAVNVEDEATKAWDRYLKFNDSVITDIFGGLLQSTVQCLTCQHRSYAFDPFLDLSVPIYKDTDGQGKGLFSSIRQVTSTAENRSTLEKCLEKFTSEEVLDGENMVTCERCNKPRKSIKQLSIFRYPKVLVVHIKRFRFNNFSREKLSTDVHFPMAGLDLSAFLSNDRPKPRLPASSNNHMEGLSSNNNNNNGDSSVDQRRHADASSGSTSSGSAFPPLHSPRHKLLLTDTSSVNHTVQSSTQSTSSSSSAPAVHQSHPTNHHQSTNHHLHQLHQQHSAIPGRSPSTASMTRPVSGLEPIPVYDLIGVSNHHGTLNGGHYIAHVDTDYGRSRGQSPRWVCFNDARVSLAHASHIAGPTAYVLFYKLRDDSSPDNAERM